MDDEQHDIRIKVAASYVDDQSEPDGVVGEQPHLNPGERFRYSSGAVLETPVGAMQGLYRMETDTGARFDAPIDAFTLAVPGLLH